MATQTADEQLQYRIGSAHTAIQRALDLARTMATHAPPPMGWTTTSAQENTIAVNDEHAALSAHAETVKHLESADRAMMRARKSAARAVPVPQSFTAPSIKKGRGADAEVGDA